MQRRRSFRSHPSGPRGLGTMVPPHSWPSRGQLPPTQLRAAAPGPAPSAAGRSQRRIRARRGPGPGGAGSERAAAAMRSPREPGEPPPQAGQCSSGPGSAGPRLGGGLPAVGRAESAPPCLQPRVGPWRTELTALRGAGMGAGQRWAWLLPLEPARMENRNLLSELWRCQRALDGNRKGTGS